VKVKVPRAPAARVCDPLLGDTEKTVELETEASKEASADVDRELRTYSIMLNCEPLGIEIDEQKAVVLPLERGQLTPFDVTVVKVMVPVELALVLDVRVAPVGVCDVNEHDQRDGQGGGLCNFRFRVHHRFRKRALPRVR